MYSRLLCFLFLISLASCEDPVLPHDTVYPGDYPIGGKSSMLWEVQSENASTAVDAVELANGDLFIAGFNTDNKDSSSLYLSRLSPAGNVLWDTTLREFRTFFKTCLAELKDGSIMVAATTNWGKNMGFVRIKDNAVTVHRIPYPRDQEYEPQEMLATDDGNFVIIGNNIYAEKLCFVSKYSPAFERLWEYQHEAGSGEQLHTIISAQDGSGDLLITGSFWGEKIFDDENLIVIRLKQDGSEVWSKTHFVKTLDPGRGIAYDESRSAYLVSAGDNGWADTLAGANYVYINEAGELIERLSNRFAQDPYTEAVSVIDTGFIAHTGNKMHIVSNRSTAIKEFWLRGDWDNNIKVQYLRNGDILTLGRTAISSSNLERFVTRRYRLE